MTQKEHFTQQEWGTLMKATALAGIGLINADKGNLWEVIQELVAYASALVKAESEYESNSLLQTMIQELRDDHNKQFYNLQADALHKEKRDEILKLVEDAVGIIQKRASDYDYATYKHFLMKLLTKIAEAADEGSLQATPTGISVNEQAFLDEVEAILG